jgi:uncharacterized lipoprotein YddW (UPF0748 family)
MVEFRGLWVTRFDWTLNPADINPTKIDEIVSNAAYAGFNAIFFQVRGTADAFYDSQYEPWSHRLTGTPGDTSTLGQDPGWDPLGHLINQAHAAGIQVHAYVNVYPVWTGCGTPPDGSTPRHLYHLVRDHHGTTNGKPNGLQWNTSDQVVCSPYQRTSPASVFVDNHLLDMATDLVTNYDIDGIHLDHIRYAGSSASCDPVSETSAGVQCFTSGPSGYVSYDAWQRAQVNGTVRKFYQQIVPLKAGLWLSAAVWPIYKNYPQWGWPSTLEGYYDYYQDSKEWLAGEDVGDVGYIDSISPMIYPSTFNCPDDSFWTQSRWNTLMTDFQAGNSGRFVIPGIGARYCTFDEIEARIDMARSAGTAGHAIFSYSGLLARSYFDDLANGPYSQPAVVPNITWHP